MKRTISFALVLALMLALFGCGQEPAESTGENPPVSTPAESVPVATTVPQETEVKYVDVEVAENSGGMSEYRFSDGNGYLIDLSNDVFSAASSWAVNVIVDDSFKMTNVKYVGVCDDRLNPIDLRIECELKNHVLTLSFTTDAEKANMIIDGMHLIIVADHFPGEGKASFIHVNQNASDTPELLDIRKFTGDIVFCESKSSFSEGYCWAELMYADTGMKFTGIIDSTGKMVAEMKNVWLTEYGDFHNGVSMVKTDTEVIQFIDTNGEVLFSSDNPEYKDWIKGIFPDGYILLERTESDLTTKKVYYTIMDCRGNMLFDWDEYGGYYVFNYLGGHVFAFLNQFKRGDYDTILLWDAQTGVTTTVRNMDGGSLWRLPELVANDSDGWVIVGQDQNHTTGKSVLVSTKDKKILDLNSEYEYGIPFEGRIAIIDTGAYDDRFEGLGYVDLETGSYKMVDYEYLSLAKRPEKIWEKLRYEAAMEVGLWPAYNAPGVLAHDNKMDMTTFLFDAKFSGGVMLLQLKGADGFDYYALMNDSGDNVMEPVKGTAVDTLGNGRFLVMRDDKHYMIDQNGNDVTILPDRKAGRILSVAPYHDGLAWVTTSMGENCFIDTDGNYVFGQNSPVKNVETVQLPAMICSAKRVEVDETDRSESDGIAETPVSSFVYEYGTVEIEMPDGSTGKADAVIITKFTGNEDTVVIPGEINGLPVLGIAQSAFEGSKIRELRFAGDLNIIEAFAFADCTQLTTVVLPDCWMRLGDCCFTGCTSLQRLELPAKSTFFNGEVWNEELGIYQYISDYPIAEEDATVIVFRDK